jgi:hypothetical protein
MRRNTMIQIKKIWFKEDRLWAEFSDGRTVDVPVSSGATMKFGEINSTLTGRIWMRTFLQKH